MSKTERWLNSRHSATEPKTISLRCWRYRSLSPIGKLLAYAHAPSGAIVSKYWDLKSRAWPESSQQRARRATESYPELGALRGLAPGWDTYDAEPPNDHALAGAETVLEAARGVGMIPAKLLPSAEGGVGIVFLAGGKQAHVECLNDGEIVFSTVNCSDGSIRAWAVTPNLVVDALLVVREYLG